MFRITPQVPTPAFFILTFLFCSDLLSENYKTPKYLRLPHRRGIRKTDFLVFRFLWKKNELVPHTLE